MCDKYIYQVFGSKSHDAKDGFFYSIHPFMIDYYSLIKNITRNIFKKDIRRLSNTDDKRNQIRWFRRGRNTLGPL